MTCSSDNKNHLALNKLTKRVLCLEAQFLMFAMAEPGFAYVSRAALDIPFVGPTANQIRFVLGAAPNAVIQPQQTSDKGVNWINIGPTITADTGGEGLWLSPVAAALPVFGYRFLLVL